MALYNFSICIHTARYPAAISALITRLFIYTDFTFTLGQMA